MTSSIDPKLIQTQFNIIDSDVAAVHHNSYIRYPS